VYFAKELPKSFLITCIAYILYAVYSKDIKKYYTVYK
jgi:hypothetical protein